MKAFLTVVLAFFILTGIYYGVKYIQPKPDINAAYAAYLEQAITRNTSSEYPGETVIFVKDDYITDLETYPGGEDTSHTPQGAIQEPNTGNNTPANNTYIDIGSELAYQQNEGGRTQGYFGTPRLPGEYEANPNCGGLIFDPCLVLGPAKPASGSMDFGSNKVYEVHNSYPAFSSFVL